MFLLKSDIVHHQKIDLSLEHIRLYMKICFVLPGKTYDKMVLEAKDLFITVIYINAYAIYDMHIKLKRFFLRSQENVNFARWQ